MRCAAIDWSNFLRVDDAGNEIVPTIKGEAQASAPKEKPSKQELLKLLGDMIENIERLPQVALTLPVTHYDLLSALLLLSEILRARD